MQEPLTESTTAALERSGKSKEAHDAQLPPPPPPPLITDAASISTSPEALKGDEHPNREQPSNVGRPPSSSSNSQFYHFMRLMQLFPTVHPATLHAVMAVCQNNFFVAVDRLLYARHRKEVRQQQMEQNGYGGGAGKSGRYMPYPCTMSCLPGGGDSAAVRVMQLMRPQTYKLEKKAMNTRSKTKMTKAQLHLLQQQQLELQTTQQLQYKIEEENAPLTLQCSVPLRSISPEVPEDLSTHDNEHLHHFAEDVADEN